MGKEIGLLDVEEIAIDVCGCEDDTEKIEEALQKKYEIGLDTYQDIIADLFDRVHVAKSPLIEDVLIGFKSKKRNVWLAKKDFTNKFVNMVIDWLGGNDIKPGDKGFKREIKKDGKIEFVITIKPYTKNENSN